MLDFAYHIHTDVGNRAMAAKVDGGFVSPDHQLKNAQVVEIFTLDSWQPDAALLSVLRSRVPMLQTKSAKKKLKLFLKKYEGQQENAGEDRMCNSTLKELVNVTVRCTCTIKGNERCCSHTHMFQVEDPLKLNLVSV